MIDRQQLNSASYVSLDATNPIFHRKSKPYVYLDFSLKEMMCVSDQKLVRNISELLRVYTLSAAVRGVLFALQHSVFNVLYVPIPLKYTYLTVIQLNRTNKCGTHAPVALTYGLCFFLFNLKE